MTSGTSIIPGSTQFYFETNVHRSIARAVIPFYAALAYNRQFSVAFAKAVCAGDVKIVSKMVRTLIRSKALVRMDAGYDEGGIALSFKYKNSKYIYRQLLFIEAL
ncbi:hypothetical protein M3231_02515 [Neobacillus mesonae]|nr:hypothetical protein [Neobacillus mesonae]